MNWAQINNTSNIVENVVVSDTMPSLSGYTYVDIDGLTCTDGNNIMVGCTWDGGTTFTDIPLDEFDRVVSMSSEDGNDIYTVQDQYAGNTFQVTVVIGTLQSVAYEQINSTQVPELSTVQSYVIGQMSSDGLNYLQNQYDPQTQLLLVLMYQESINQALISLNSYLQPFVTFLLSLQYYKGNMINTINNQSTISAVLNVTWNFATVAYPNVNLVEASAIAAG